MKETRYTFEIKRELTREEQRRERRWRIAENVVNVLLGIGAAAALFWAGWLMGSGAFVIGR